MINSTSMISEIECVRCKKREIISWDDNKSTFIRSMILAGWGFDGTGGEVCRQCINKDLKGKIQNEN